MKDRILDAAAYELSLRGLKFTVDSVAVQLGISKKTLYLYFPSKQALLGGIIDALLTDITRQHQRILNEKTELGDRITAILTVKPGRFCELHESVIKDIRRSYPEEWQKIKDFHYKQLALLLSLLEQGQKCGAIRPVNTHIAAVMLSSAVSQVLKSSILAEQNLTIADALKQITDLFLNGLLVNPAEPKKPCGGAA